MIQIMQLLAAQETLLHATLCRMALINLGMTSSLMYMDIRMIIPSYVLLRGDKTVL